MMSDFEFYPSAEEPEGNIIVACAWSLLLCGPFWIAFAWIVWHFCC